MNRNIIVTGGLGFIGSNLIDLLIKKKYFVINLDKVTYSSNFYNVKDHSKNYKFIKTDISNRPKILKILRKYKPKFIYNLAAETHVDRSIDGPKNFINSNIVSLFKFLECLRSFHKINKSFRLIHISTDEVYGDILHGRSNEDYPYKPSSPYAASKAASDHLVYSYYRTYELPFLVTNCSNNYGPKQHPEKLIPKLIYNILNNLPLPLYGNGKNSREWLHVADHCAALHQVATKGKLGEFYNIGSRVNFSNLKITNLLIKIAKKYMALGKETRIRFIKDRPGHDVRYALNSKKIKKEIKWKSKIKIEKGLEETFKWYLDNKKYFMTIKKNHITKRLGKG